MDVQSQPASKVPQLPLEAQADLDELLRRQPRLTTVARLMLEAASSPWRVRSLQMLARCRSLDAAGAKAFSGGQHVVAFFDLDGTMLQGSIIQQLTRQAFAEGQGRIGFLLRFLICFVLYKMNLIPRLTMYRWGFETAAGRRFSEAQDFVDRCLERYIKPRIYREAMQAVAAHRAAGHRCVAVTGAPDYAAAEVATSLGMDDLLATPTPLTEDGVLTAEVQEPVCYSDGKLAYVRAYASRHDVDLSRSFFYSDSASDIPVLKAVGRPRVINPQVLLRMFAWTQRWVCAEWRTLDRGGIPVTAFSRSIPLVVSTASDVQT